MRKTLVTEDTTLLGLEQFLAEAREGGAKDEDEVRVLGEVTPDARSYRAGRRASLSIDLPTSLVRRLVRR
jgi:hypothetical protein